MNLGGVSGDIDNAWRARVVPRGNWTKKFLRMTHGRVCHAGQNMLRLHFFGDC